MEEIKMRSVPQEEQETVINFSYGDKVAWVYSSAPAIVRRLLKYTKDYQDQCHIMVYDQYGIEITMPIDWVSFKPKKKRVLSEEQRAAAAERLRAARESK